MAQTPVNMSSAQFQATRDRTGSLSANSVKFSHARSSSIGSSIEEEIFQPPYKIGEGSHSRGSFESLGSVRRSIVDDIQSPAKPLAALQTQQRSPSVMFKNSNGSSSTLLPLTRTVSFSSIQNAPTTPISSSDSSRTSYSAASGATAKQNRLSRLFSTKSKSSSRAGDSSVSSHYSPNSARTTSALPGSVPKSNILQRQMSRTRSIKEKRNLKKPLELSIQTSNLGSSKAERQSPMIRSAPDVIPEETLAIIPNLTEAIGSSASVVSPALAPTSSLASGTTKHKHHHHHHHLHISHHNILRPRSKDNPLSSSSSNSKLISGTGETLYSFSMTGVNGSSSDLQRTLQQLERLNFKELDHFADKDVMGDECLSLLSSCIMPIFKGSRLKVPVELLNRCVELFTYLRIQEFQSTATPTRPTSTPGPVPADVIVSVFAEVQHLFDRGFETFYESFNADHENDSINSKVAKAWNKFRADILYHLEGVFMPLQLELEAASSASRPDTKSQMWGELASEVDQGALNVKRLILLSFRDAVIIPIFENDEEANWIHDDVRTVDSEHEAEEKNAENARLVLQCLHMLKGVESHDSRQNLIERLLTDQQET